MNHKCQMVRDLIPLCVDGVASEESRKYVEEHTAECEDCRQYLESMKQELPENGSRISEGEEKMFRAAARNLRRKNYNRKLKTVILGIGIGILLVFAYYGAWHELYANKSAVVMNVEDYEIQLSQLESGKIIANVVISDCRVSGGWEMQSAEGEDGTVALEMNLWTSVIPRKEGDAEGGGSFMTSFDPDEYSAVYVGKNRDKLIWKKGDHVPPASQELEAYCSMTRELDLLYAESDYEERVAYITSRYHVSSSEAENQKAQLEREEKQKRLQEEISTIVAKIPEWQ